jgi:hypothetical protein
MADERRLSVMMDASLSVDGYGVSASFFYSSCSGYNATSFAVLSVHAATMIAFIPALYYDENTGSESLACLAAERSSCDRG